MRHRFAALAVFVPAAFAFAQAPVVGIWDLDETSGFLAADSGPHANHGALVNFTSDPAQWAPGVQGNALVFDGLDDHVSFQFNGGLPFYRGLGDAFSICMWVNGAPTHDDRILSAGSSTSDTPLFTLGTGSTAIGNADKLRIYLRNDQGYSSARYSAATVFDNTWHHIAYVETSGQGKLYVDGVRDTGSMDGRFLETGTRSATYGTYSLDNLAIGGVLRPSVCCHFQGMLDSLRIYGFELSASDVTTVMNGGSPNVCRASIGELGPGCGPGPLDLYAAGHPVIGGSLLFTMRGGQPNATALLGLGVGPVTPIDLTTFGAPGCTLYPTNATFLGVGSLDAYGSTPAAIPFSIPNIPALSCLTVAFQGVDFTPSSADFSNAIVAVLGL